MHLTALFDPTFRERASQPALEWADASGVSRYTFAEVDARASRMARELAARGLAAGDRLCVHLANGVPFVDLFLACTRLGAIVVPINVLYRVTELQHIVRDAEPRAVVVHAGSDASYPPDATLWTVEDLVAGAQQREASPVAAEADGRAPALIIYTSGTTGAAKGAVLSHDNLAANAQNLVLAWRVTADDRYLAVLPLFHVHGLGNGLCSWLLSGCRMRLHERFEHQQAERWFREYQPTLFFGVPTIYARLIDPAVVPRNRIHDMTRSMRLFVSGSAPLSIDTFTRFHEWYERPILERYGMSEALMLISNPYDGERRAGTVGQPLPGVQVRVVDEEGAVVTGTAGELQVKSPTLFGGYWRNDTATAAAFTRDGWFRTGDLGELSEDGYYSLLGRKHDLIISGGFNIYPAEIEQHLLALPGVKEAAVVGVPDPVRGEVPVAYVVANAAVTATDLAAWCKGQLASFKAPRAFVRLDALPRTALGKVQKHLLPPWTP